MPSKIKKLENSEKIEKIINELKERLLQDYKNVVDIKIKDIKQYLQVFKNIKINKLYIQATIGTEEAPITAYLVTIISLVITFFSARNIDNIYYQIFPEYRKGNYLNLTLKCIISTKIVHIINIARVLRLTKDSRDNKQLTNEKMYK